MNKRFNVAIELPIVTESRIPDSAHITVYAKDDGKVYKKNSDGVETEIQVGDYIAVNTISDRNSIPLAYRKLGMLAYVSEDNSNYRLVGGLDDNSWVFQEYEINRVESTESKTYYLSPDGDDITGDGTELNPWKTLRKAFVSIPSVLKHVTTIFLKAGVYDVFDVDLDILNSWVLHARLDIMGEVGLVTTEFTTTGQSTHSNNPFRRNLAGGKTFDSVNQYTGYAAACQSGELYYTPIGQHGLDYVTVSNFAEGWHLNQGIYEYKTVLNFERNRLPASLSGSQRLRFQRFKVQFLSTINAVLVSEFTVDFVECVFLPFGNRIIRAEGQVEFSRCLFLTEATTNPCLRVYNTFTVGISSCQLVHVNPAVSRESAVRLRNAELVLQMVFIQGFAYGIREESDSSLTQFYGHYPLIFENIGCLFSLRGSNFKLSRGAWYGTNRMFIEDVNYFFSLEGGTHNIQVDLRNYIQNSKTFLIQPFVTSTSRVWQGGANLTNSYLQGVPSKLVDLNRNFILIYDSAFQELDSIKQSVANGASVQILVGDVVKNKTVNLRFSLVRGGFRESGFISLTNQNDTDIYVEAEFDDCGLRFGKSVSGDSILLDVVDENPTGTGSVFEANIERLMV